MKLRNGIRKDMTVKEALEIADKQIADENNGINEWLPIDYKTNCPYCGYKHEPIPLYEKVLYWYIFHEKVKG